MLDTYTISLCKLVRLITAFCELNLFCFILENAFLFYFIYLFIFYLVKMGLAFSNLFNRIWGKHDMTMAVVGLPNAGKSTMIRKLDIGQVETSTPISGLELETLKYKNVTFKVWDISNSEEIRNHYKQCKVIGALYRYQDCITVYTRFK